MSALTRPIRSLLGSLREAMSNEGIRRLEASWALGIAADTGLLVVLLASGAAPAWARSRSCAAPRARQP